MFIPSKHENLNTSIIVLGAEILNVLSKKHMNIEELFEKIRVLDSERISLIKYYDTITFLWLIDAIEYDNKTYIVYKVKSNVIKKAL